MGAGVRLHVSVPAEQCQKAYNKLMKELREATTVQGFRKGKVRMPLVGWCGVVWAGGFGVLRLGVGLQMEQEKYCRHSQTLRQLCISCSSFGCCTPSHWHTPRTHTPLTVPAPCRLPPAPAAQAPDAALIAHVGGVQRVYNSVLSEMLEPMVAKVRAYDLLIKCTLGWGRNSVLSEMLEPLVAKVC